MSVSNKSLSLLVRTARVAPFAICAIVCIAYIESVYSLYTEYFIVCDNEDCILNHRISEFIACYVLRYDWVIDTILIMLSFGLKMCIWNKLCVSYLMINIWERYYLDRVELYPEQIYFICGINIAVCVFLIAMGIRQRMKNKC